MISKEKYEAMLYEWQYGDCRQQGLPLCPVTAIKTAIRAIRNFVCGKDEVEPPSITDFLDAVEYYIDNNTSDKKAFDEIAKNIGDFIRRFDEAHKNTSKSTLRFGDDNVDTSKDAKI